MLWLTRKKFYMAKSHVSIQDVAAFGFGLLALLSAQAQGTTAASDAASSILLHRSIMSAQAAPQPVASPPPEPPRRWLQMPPVHGRLTSKDIGLVINTADPYSVEVGEFYIKMRQLAPKQVLRLVLPAQPGLTPQEFQTLAQAVQAHFGPATQALALAWTTPFAVNCNAITGALTLGYDDALCANSCAPSKRSPYFYSESQRPYQDLKLRPTMLLAARSVAQAKAMIRRGVQSDGSLGLRGAPPVNAYFVTTNDSARSARAPLFPPAGLVAATGVQVHLPVTQALQNIERLLVYQTGLPQVDQLDTLQWVPGAVADHLTSFGGSLLDGHGQMSILEWIRSGATASYGTVSEPCAHPQKFPHPQVLLTHYMQGASLIEAYWKSVAWPQQGVFVGEPLAAPFAQPSLTGR
jgi:uncharacterized protein (TIGR03790 family)